MKIELNKDELIDLVTGVTPVYEWREKMHFFGLGMFSEETQKYIWNDFKLENKTEQELYNLYISCKKSNKSENLSEQIENDFNKLYESLQVLNPLLNNEQKEELKRTFESMNITFKF